MITRIVNVETFNGERRLEHSKTNKKKNKEEGTHSTLHHRHACTLKSCGNNSHFVCPLFY